MAPDALAKLRAEMCAHPIIQWLAKASGITPEQHIGNTFDMIRGNVLHVLLDDDGKFNSCGLCDQKIAATMLGGALKEAGDMIHRAVATAPKTVEH